MNSIESPEPSDKDADEPAFMELDAVGRGGKWRGFLTWLIFYLVIAGILVAFFIRFTASAVWAIGLVGFMLAYMAIMGRWAGGNINRRE
jgi:hypothetical protein